MKKLSGRGPLWIVLEPKRRVRELARFDVEVHGERCADCDDGASIGWTATRHAGMFVESLRLEASISHREARAADPDSEIEWTLTASCVPDHAWFGGPTAAGSTVVAGAVAFWVTYESIAWLPRKPSLHFALASVILFVTFGVLLVALYALSIRGSKKLVARLKRHPNASMLARIERLAAMAAAVPELGVTP